MDYKQKEYIQKVMDAAAKIHSLPDLKGSVECPICKGKVHFAKVGPKKHVWAKCSTPDCLSFME